MSPIRSQRVILQRGKGLGSFLGSLGRIFIPMMKKAVPVISKIAKSKTVRRGIKRASKAALKSSVKVAADLLEGKKPKQAFNSEIERVKTKIIKKLKSVGKKKNKTKKRPRTATRKKYRRAMHKSILE